MLRLGSTRCGQCSAQAPAANWAITHLVILGLVFLLAFTLVLLLPGRG